MQKQMNDPHQRLLQITALLDRAEDGLERSRKRLFDGHTIDADWVKSVELMPEREDMMEAFVSKFNRFQDMMGDKLLPTLLTWKGERSAAFIDNLNRAERFGWIESSEQWLEARALRNKLVHEYMVDHELFAQSLQLANKLSLMLLQTWLHMRSDIKPDHETE